MINCLPLGRYFKKQKRTLNDIKNAPNVFLNELNEITKLNTITLPFYTKLKHIAETVV